MKKIYLLGLAVLLISCTFLSNVSAQKETRWRLPEGATARYGKGWINDIEFSPDANFISVATTIGVWTYDVHTGNAVNLFTGNMSGANAISYASNSNILAAAHWDRKVHLWDVSQPRPEAPHYTFDENPGPIYAVAISPNGRMVASGGTDRHHRGNTESGGLIRIWDLQTKELRPILRYNATVSTIAFSPNSRWIAGGSRDGTVRVWDAGTGERIYEFTEDTEPIWKLEFSPDSKLLLSLSLDGTGRLIDLVPPRQELATFRQDRNAIYAASFSPNTDEGNYTIVTGSEDKKVRFWPIDANRHDDFSPDGHPLVGHNDTVWTLAFSKDGKNIASGSLDGTVRLWDVDLRHERFPIMGHTGGIKALAYTEDNRIRACGTGLDGILRFWDAGTGGQLSLVLEHAGLTEAVTFSSDGRTLASGGSETRAIDTDDARTILLSDVSKLLNNDLDNNSLLRSLTGNRDGITAIALSAPVRGFPSSETPKTLACGGKDAKIHLLDVATGRELTTLTGSTSTVTALSFSPNNKMLFSGEANGTVRVWDAHTGEKIGDFAKSDNAITALAFSAFSPRFRFLAIADEIGKIQLFDFARQSKIDKLTSHTRKITVLIFSENEPTLVSGSEDGTILLWDLRRFTENQRDDHPLAPHRATPLAQEALNATVYLEVERQGGQRAQGSGFFVRPGYVATNYHVIEGAETIIARLVGTETTYTIEEIIATDEKRDLAIIKIIGGPVPQLTLGNSDEVRIGETVYAVGNPKGLEGTVSRGIVSSMRDFGQNGIRIQIDAPISPGNSGGPVLNQKGEVIGVSVSGMQGIDAQNLNFAVPSNYLKKLLREIR